ncbi:MAG: carboxypeptidase-like regulatory domain-containing protein [bacterium]|nr:carboxypeptidase-like regulatory domain-containing protein [bacterium]
MRRSNAESLRNAARCGLLPLGLAATLSCQEHHARLHGLVLDPHSRPAVNAAITIDHGDEKPRRAFTDATGQFRVTRLPAGRLVVRVVAETERGPQIGAAAVNRAAADPRHVTIRTRPARKITGVVRGAAGEPIAGAWVSATPFGFAACRPLAQSSTTDEAGQYELTHVPCGRLELRAWSAVHRGATATLPHAGEPHAEVDLTMAEGEPVVHTVTLLGAAPKELESAHIDLRITAAAARHPLPPGLVRRDPNDATRWTIRGWPIADELRLATFADAVTFEPAESRIRAFCSNRTKRFHALVDEYRHIRGELVTDHELGLGGRRLVARAVRRGETVETTGITRADGSFEFRSPTPTGDHFVLRCPAEDLVLVDADSRRALRALRHPSQVFLQHGRRRFHEVEARPAWRLTGTAHTATGAPYPFAMISILLVDAERMIRRLPDWRTLGDDGGVFAVTDERGHFTLTGLDLTERDVIRVLVSGADGYGDHTAPLADNRAVDLGTIASSRGMNLTAAVTDPSGAPAIAAPIRIMTSGTLRPIYLATDRDGRFTARNLPPGPCIVALLDSLGQEVDHEISLGRDPSHATAVDLTIPQ